MSAYLITDSEQIKKEVDLDVDKATMQSKIYLEGSRDRLPILVKNLDSYTLLTRRIEIGNYLEPGYGAQFVQTKSIDLKAYDNYFTMSEIGSQYPAYASEGEALRDGLKLHTAIAYADMPYSRYCRICKFIDVQLENNLPDNMPFYAYEVDMDYVQNIFTQVDPKYIDLAVRMLKERTHVSDIECSILLCHMTKPRENQFALLSTMMDENNIDEIWLDTKLNIHSITALPWDALDDGTTYAYYNKKHVLLFSTTPRNYLFLKEIGKYDSYQTLVKRILVSQRIGIEEKSLPVGRVATIGKDRCKNVSAILTLWRDRSAYQFLPYYIINGIGNSYALNMVAAYAKRKITEGFIITESNLEKKYQQYLQQFMRQYQFDDIKIEKYFVGIQAGSRCPFAALPTRYICNKNINTLRFDCGTQLFKNGILLSGSDLCRSCCLTEETKAVYDLLGEIIRVTIIPAIHDGMSGKDAYWLGVHKLAEYEQVLKANGMLDTAFSVLRQYNRNIGHTFDKTESCSVTLDKNDIRAFETNMIGCVEFQWPYQDKTLGVEDMFFVAPECTINFTF